MSVNGGWNGLPDQPRNPLNVRPRSVIDGRNANLRMVVTSWCPGQCHELLPGPGIVPDQAVEGRGDGTGTGGTHTSDRHALVIGLDHDADSPRFDVVLQPGRDLLGQALLHLEVAGEQLDH